MREPWSKVKFCEIFNDYENPDTIYDADRIKIFLKHMERVALLYYDGILTKNHVKELFGSDLKYIRDKTAISRYMKCKHNEKSFYYSNLTKLVEESKTWI